MAYKAILLPLILAITITLAFRIEHLEFSGEIGSYLSESDEEYGRFIDHAERFGSFEPYVIMIDAHDVTSPEILRQIESLSSRLEEDYDVEQVISLTHSPVNISRDPDNPLFKDLLMRNDGRQTAILVLADAIALDAHKRLSLAQRIRELARSVDSADVTVVATGPSVIALDAMQLGRQEFQKMYWLAPLVLGIAMLAIFRGHPAVIAPAVVVGIALLWTLALYELAGNRLTLMSAMMPVVISIVAFADAVHILHRYFLEVAAGHDKDFAIHRTMGFMNVTCMMTSLTTAIGFLALCAVTSIEAVRQFTLWTAIGVMIAFALIIILMPIVLCFLPLPGEKHLKRDSSLILRMVATLGSLSSKRFRPLLLVVVALAAALAWGSTQQDVRTAMEGFLPQDIPSVRAYASLQGTEVRAETIDVVVELADGSFMDPVNARALWQLERALMLRFDEIRSIRSITEAIEGLHARTGTREFPDDDLDLEEYLLAIELAADESWLRRFLTEDYRAARIAVEIDSRDSNSTLQVFEDVEAWLSHQVPVNWGVSTTGPMKLLVLNIRALVNSQLTSFLLALAAISAVIYLYLRNTAMTVASTVVNLLPVLITMGLFPLLAVAGIVSADVAALNASTVMVPGLAMALVVDDTIHFLACYGESRKDGNGVDRSIEHAYRGAGFAISATTVVMILGLATLYLSDIPANTEFATMLIIAIGSALAADLLLLPNLLRYWVAQRHA